MSHLDPKAAYRIVNPVSGQTLKTFATATDAEVDTAIASAHAAFGLWREVPVAERALIVQRVGDLFVERAAELAAHAAEEMGKSLAEGHEEAVYCGDIFAYFSEHGPALVADQPITSFSGGRAVVQRRPIGAVLGIMPWNYPFYQVARFAAPNLMLGNTIVLKHAESVPGSALAIESIMRDAELPDGVYVNVFASHDQVERMIFDDRVAGVSLTGSQRAGAAVAALAGQNLKRCVLELGGSDPYVVLDTDDVVAAADLAWDTRMANAGQACNSNKRIIVMNDLFDAFVARLTERAAALKPSDPAKPDDTGYPPLSSRAAAEMLDGQVQDAVQQGATLHTGGVLTEGSSGYYSPAVLTGVTPQMRAYHEELFGPVAVVYPVASDSEALALANDTSFGLGGAVFSADEDRARSLAQRLDVGMANVNAPAGEGAELPFGGTKRSGFGRELGPLGMDEFVNKRTFYVAEGAT